MDPGPAQTRLTSHQLGIVLVVAAVQLVNILDFVMVMPMGPFFASALGFSEAHVGYIGGAYTAAAGLSGLLGARFVDRFDRRPFLALALAGLVVGTALAGMANSLETLLAARVVAGLFGGPATSAAFAIVADVVPPPVRGRAMGIVMGAFSIAQVLGVPGGLWLAETAGWRAPFFTLAALGAAVAVWAYLQLPSMTDHRAKGHTGPRTSLRELVSRPVVQTSYALTATVMMAGFLVIPNIAVYAQLNLGVLPEHLKVLYFTGGLASLVTLQVGGRLVDAFGSFRVGALGSVAVALVVFGWFYLPVPVAPVMPLFVAFMVSMNLRNVSHTTLTTKVPAAAERASFQSLQSAVQNGASAFAAVLSASLLARAEVPVPGGGTRALLVGMPRVAAISIALCLLIPVLLWAVETRLRAQAQATAAPATAS